MFRNLEKLTGRGCKTKTFDRPPRKCWTPRVDNLLPPGVWSISRGEETGVWLYTWSFGSSRCDLFGGLKKCPFQRLGNQRSLGRCWELLFIVVHCWCCCWWLRHHCLSVSMVRYTECFSVFFQTDISGCTTDEHPIAVGEVKFVRGDLPTSCFFRTEIVSLSFFSRHFPYWGLNITSPKTRREIFAIPWYWLKIDTPPRNN